MLKRICALCLALLFVVPCLTFFAFADSEYHFTTSVDTDGVAIYPGSIPDGNYYLSGSGVFSGGSGSISFADEFVNVMFAGDNGELVSDFSTSLSFNGSSVYVVLIFDGSDTLIAVGCDDGVFLGDFVLSSSAGDSSSYRNEFIFNEIYSGNVLPPEGRYNLEITFDGETTYLPVELFYGQFAGIPDTEYFSLSINRDRLYALKLMYHPSLGTGAELLDNYDNKLEGTVVFKPIAKYNGLPVLLESIGSALNSVVQFSGFVIGSILAPDGVMAQLWPLVGLGVAFVLVYAGVGLIRRFAP